MTPYVPPIDDIAFLLKEVLDFDDVIAGLQGHEEVNADLAISVLEEAGRFCRDVVEPLNRPGDEAGAKLKDGSVQTPVGTKEAYRAFTDAGWPTLSADVSFGGQGLPRVLQVLLDEMLSATSMSFGLFPGLTRGAIEAISHHASNDLKGTWLPKMVSGEWTGAMALTEASAGTDLGMLSTRAEPAGGDRYRITGTKIFISSGDHDFGGNIIHLILARLPNAPVGVKGISLFLSPKYLLNDDGSLGERNAISVGALERKMGIHAQPTCVMNYDGAIAWLVGEPGRGLNAMFTMMNAERLFVGIQGLGIAEAATQKAVSYARERLQGRAPDGTRGPVPIIEHADVRRMLLTGRALADGCRALAVWTAMQMDVAARHPDHETRAHADETLALMTPVVKAAFTDFGFEVAVLSQQVFGGHGYIREWGMEQFVRDARITQIYEGTNGVQAMDLVGRKLAMNDGKLTARFFALVRDDLERHAGAGSIAAATRDALTRLENTTALLRANPAASGAMATDYLRLFALTSLGWMWTRMAAAAVASNTPLKRRKQSLAKFYADRILPQTLALEAAIAAGPASTMDLEADLF